LEHFETVEYDDHFKINDNVSFTFKDAGHILGSAITYLDIIEDNNKLRLCYTGDIGRYDSALLENPSMVEQCDYLICESTYGNRLHSNYELCKQQFLSIIEKTCVEQKGKVVIPAFSLGRTQELVFVLDQLEHNGDLPHINVYVDSPLSVNATKIMRKNSHLLNDRVQKYLEIDGDPFGFDRLFYIQEATDSKAINALKEPAIVISASGMATAGRIKHHIANTVSDPKNTIVIVGYAEPQSLAGKLRNGEKKVRIFGEEFEVNASIEVLDAYSAHADYQEMQLFLSPLKNNPPKGIFLVHGDYEAQTTFKEHLKNQGYKNIQIPSLGDKAFLF
jgi:metallo-beta-lactamase family protein